MRPLIPSEISLAGVYFPPFFVAVLLGLGCAAAAAGLLNRAGLGKYFWHPPLAFAALWVLAASLIGLWLIAP